MATRLKKLRVREISGVDDPANEHPDWIVAKATGFKQEVEEFEKEIGDGFDILDGEAMELYLSDAPDDVRKAAEKLLEHLSKDVEDDDEVEDGSEADEVEEPTRKSLGQRLREMAGVKKSADDEEDADEDEDESDEEGSEDEDESGDEDFEDEGDDEGDDDVEKAFGGIDPDQLAAAIESVVDARFDQHMAKAAGSYEDEVAREAVVSVADRLEAVEKHLSARTSLDGEELLGSDEPESTPRSELHKAVVGAVKHGKVTLT